MNVVKILVISIFLFSCSLKDEGEEMVLQGEEFVQKMKRKVISSGEEISDKSLTPEQLELERLKSRKKQFTGTLKREYLKLAEKLIQVNNYTDATYFRRKGYNVDTYLDILPEKPEDWKIKNDYNLNALRIARLALINSLNFNVITVAPKPAAQAIVYYDCWVEQEQNRWRKDDIDCKNTFRQAQTYVAQINRETKGKSLIELKKEYNFIDLEESGEIEKVKPEPEKYQGAYSDDKPVVMESGAKQQDDKKPASSSTTPKSMATKTKSVANANKAKPVSTVTPTANKVFKTTPSVQNSGFIVADALSGASDMAYLAYFQDNSVTVDDKAKQELDKAVLQIKNSNPPNIILNGHTDKSFDSSTSLEISKQRADATRDYLVSKGISKDIIRTYGFGKTDNIVKNKDGEKVPANNRVEVIFKGKSKNKKQ